MPLQSVDPDASAVTARGAIPALGVTASTACGLVVGHFTVMCRMAGVGSASPRWSVTVKVTVNVPARLKTTAPGSSTVWFAAPPPKSHRKASGRSPSGSVPVPVNFTLWPTVIATSLEGVLIVPFGGWLGRTTLTGAVAVFSWPPSSVTVTLAVQSPTA